MSEQMTSSAEELVKFLGCPCTFFAPMSDDEPLMAAYRKALHESNQTGGFVPVIVVPSDTLLETLIANSDEASNGEDYHPDNVAAFRKTMLELDTSNGETELHDLVSIAEDLLSDDPLLFERMINEKGGNVEVNHQFLSYWDYDTGRTQPVILARIPVSQPYDIFSYLPMGGWNACPNNASLMAISRLWQEQFGAIPSVISSDSVEYQVEHAVKESDSKDLAIKQYAFCPSLIEESDGITISSHATALQSSTVWYFWWD